MTDQELLSLCNERLDYNPDTGVLSWNECRKSRGTAGREVGCLGGRGYRSLTLDGICYRAHRIVFLMFHGYLPKQVDHINGDKSDTRIINLRAATNAQNSQNKPKPKSNTSGYKGINRAGKRWSSYIAVNKKRIYLGTFTCKHEAAKAYNKAAIEYHGEFAYLNIIP